MNRRVVMGIVVVLLLIVGALAVGGVGFRLGMMQGLAANPQLAAPGNGAVNPYMMYGAPFMYGRPFGWGFGFGFLQCLFPLLGFLLIFMLIRGLVFGRMWGGRRGWGEHGWGRHGFGPGGQDFGPGGQGVPPMFAEWHQRSHAAPAADAPGQPPAAGNQ